MARAQQNEKAATVRTTSTSRGARTRSKSAMVALTASALALAWAGVELSGAGRAMYAYGFFFTEFFAGVVALVSLSLTVMMGLLATDRLVLLIRHRVLLQSAHRATGILGVAGLVVHVITKISIGRAGPTDAVVPFIGGRGLYVGLGTVASFLMVSVLWTGLIRVRFAGVGPKWFWRALHSMAYVSWPFALIHGLNAGRPAKSWVVVSYLACVLLVVVALLVRFSVHLGKRSREQHQAAVLNQAMAGKPTEESRGLLGGLVRRRSGEEEKSRAGRGGRKGGWAETTATSWSAPAGTARRRDPERFAVPVVPEPGSLREPVRAAARRRAAEPEPATRGRADERSASRYRDAEEGVPRRYRDEVDARYSAPPPRWVEPEEPWDSPRRWASGERPVSAEPISAGPISAGPVSAGPISAAPRSGGRHSVEEEVPEEPDYWRPPARYVPDDLPVDDTPTLVDLASRRALRAAGESRSSRRRRASADAVDGAYWAGLRGEAK
ncbi:ferric reductase-like transmembrane domain-containing protein [Micromonospora sp. IBHARD004]|uniref:ferric reductase-like transmembrane domain-containing protein n=1 Tax=Micromonospora sp. IBHARD004 TaxID=3457764 RepID=UPI00405A3E6D